MTGCSLPSTAPARKAGPPDGRTPRPGRPTRGHRFAAEAGKVLDQADTRVVDARGHLEAAFAAAGHADDRARQLAKLAESEGKGRIALRLAGTSLKEYRELTQRLTGERAACLQTEADSKREVRQALREAWDVVQQSRFADSLGVASMPVPDHVEKVAERLVEMRSIAERRGHSMDKRDRDDVGRAIRQAGEFRGHAAGHRAQAADARAIDQWWDGRPFQRILLDALPFSLSFSRFLYYNGCNL